MYKLVINVYLWYNMHNLQKQRGNNMAYNGANLSHTNHDSFVKISSRAREERMNYGQYVGQKYLSRQLTIKEKINIMKETGTFGYKKASEYPPVERVIRTKKEEETEQC